MASRFVADAAARADLIALYALDHELERIGQVAREPLARQIRLTWWREAVGEAFASQPPRRHPVVEALALAASRHRLAAAPLQAAIDARFDALDATPFGEAASANAYFEATEGGLIRTALDVLAPDRGDDSAIAPAARAWGLAGLARQARLTPSLAAEARLAVEADVAEARAAARRLPSAAFPALAHVALASSYAAGRNPSELAKRLRLIAAVLTGRL